MDIKPVNNAQILEKVTTLFLNVMTKPPYNERWNKETALVELSEIYKEGKDFCFIAMEDNFIEGFIFSRLQPWEMKNHLVIEYIIVNPESRKKGMGTLLFRETEKIARKNKINHIHLISYRQAMAKAF